MQVIIKESFNLLMIKIYADFSEITQITFKMCLSSINHEYEKIYITEEYVHMPYQCQMIIEVARNE